MSRALRVACLLSLVLPACGGGSGDDATDAGSDAPPGETRLAAAVCPHAASF